MTFAENPYDTERYTAIRTIAAEMIGHGAGAETSGCLICSPAMPGTPRRKWMCVASCSRMGRSSWSKSDPMAYGPCQGAGLTRVIPQPVRSSVRSGKSRATRPVPPSCSPSSTAIATIHPPHVNHIYKVFIRCEIIGGSPTTSHEIQGVGFFAEVDIPELSLTRNEPSQIARKFEHYRHPDLPADFD